MNLKKRHDNIHDRAQKINKELRADDRRFDGTVIIVDIGGSFQVLHYAFFTEYEDEAGVKWVVVFCEHYPPQLFCREDLDIIMQYPELIIVGKEMTQFLTKYKIDPKTSTDGEDFFRLEKEIIHRKANT